MPKFQAPRGTRDLLPPERGVFLRLEETARDLASRYGYQPIETPLFEQASVYERGVGEATDVVEKELFRVQAGRGEEERGKEERGDDQTGDQDGQLGSEGHGRYRRWSRTPGAWVSLCAGS